MNYIELKKLLLDAEITLPKFADLIKVNESNLRSYKKKDTIPNPIAVSAKCIALLHSKNIDYKSHIKELKLDIKKNKKNSNNI